MKINLPKVAPGTALADTVPGMVYRLNGNKPRTVLALRAPGDTKTVRSFADLSSGTVLTLGEGTHFTEIDCELIERGTAAPRRPSRATDDTPELTGSGWTATRGPAFPDPEGSSPAEPAPDCRPAVPTGAVPRRRPDLAK